MKRGFFAICERNVDAHDVQDFSRNFLGDFC
jgi:hypothetical protein